MTKGLSAEALEWLKNYLVMEIAGLTWRPVAKNGRFNLHNEIQFATNPVLLKPDLAIRLIEIFLTDVPGVVAKLKTAVASSDSPEIRQQSHWLKSAAANVGARHLSELAQLLETYAVKNDTSRNQLLFAEIESKIPDVESWLEDVKKNAAVAIARSKKFEDSEKDMSKPAKVLGQAPSTPTETRHNARVLVVDDSSVSREVAAEFVGELVTTVEFAKDGGEALEKWASGNYDVILMDCEMVPVSGIDATKQIRAKEQEDGIATTPIIALTGNVLENQQEEAVAAGMNDYLTKPYAPEALEKALTKWIDPETRIAALKEASEKMRAADETDIKVNAKTDGEAIFVSPSKEIVIPKGKSEKASAPAVDDVSEVADTVVSEEDSEAATVNEYATETCSADADKEHELVEKISA